MTLQAHSSLNQELLTRPEKPFQPVSLDGLLAGLKAEADRRLDLLLHPRDGLPASLLEAMRYSALAPGKRMRPVLVALGHRACLGNRPGSIDFWPAACAIELIHVYSLVHDDLPAMDDDDTRRGQPTCHRKFDEATAILVGDGLQALAFEVLAEAYPGALGTRCVLELARAAGPAGMVGGQVDDLAWENRQPLACANGAKPEKSVEALESLHSRKTGALIRAALKLGALVATGDPDRSGIREDMARLDQFGACLGLAFQITDDLLDVEGDASKAGKKVGKDAARGKLTYPGLVGVNSSRDRLAILEREALAALAPWGEAAAPLRAVLEKVIRRDH